jgi:beta-N-acetylhexosaminidase
MGQEFSGGRPMKIRFTWLLLLALLGLLLSPFTPAVEGAPLSQVISPEQKAAELLKTMTPEEKVGQLFLVSFNGTDFSSESDIYDLVVNHHVGGVVLRADNDNFIGPNDTVRAAAELISGLQNLRYQASLGTLINPDTSAPNRSTYIPLFVGISQEGDLYPLDQILNGVTALPSPMAIGATWNPELAEEAGMVLGEELHAMGFNLFLGPSLDVLDVALSESENELGSRMFGGDPFWVGEMGKAYIRGIHLGSRYQMAVIAKHFPGRGSSDRLPEEEVATVRKSLEQLKLIELAPFFTVTRLEESEGAGSTVEGLMVSHIRYQGFQGNNIRDTTPPVSLDAVALKQILDLEPFAEWYQRGGIIVSDSLGSNAVRRFYDPAGLTLDARLVARNAFMAGNDLLYLNDFIEAGDEDSHATILRTLDSFTQKYREDPAFAERVDRSVERLLRLKYTLYPDFNLEKVVPKDDALNAVGKSQAVTFEIARQAVTLISPDPANLTAVVPSPPDTRDQIVFFTDVQNAKQCSTCPEQAILAVDSLKNAVVRLYGSGAGGQIIESYLNSYTFRDLLSYLNGPEGSPALGVNLRNADWIVFAILNPRQNAPETLALKRLLNERFDLIRNKQVIVFAFNAPYYLDATDISKITAYYGLFSKAPPFIDVAARMLFQELPSMGALPVSVPGIGYDLLVATSPDPTQVIPLYIDTPEMLPTPEGSITPAPTEVPAFQVGDTIPLRTGLIYDHNRNPVPDGTVVRFIFTINSDASSSQQIFTTTVDGVARASYKIPGAANLEIRVVSEPAVTSQILVLNVTEGAGAEVTAIVPTAQPTETLMPTPTEVPTPTPTPIVVVEETPSAGVGDWFLTLLLVWGSAVGIAWVGKQRASLRWGVRWGLLAVVAGFTAYIFLALNWLGEKNWFIMAGTPGILLGCLIGVLIGWGIGWLWQSRLAKKPNQARSAQKGDQQA